MSLTIRCLLIAILGFLCAPAGAGEVPPLASRAAAHAERHYAEQQIDMLAKLVRFETVHREGVPNEENPEFLAFTNLLRSRAESFGLDFKSLGPVLVIGLGESSERIGIVTHGDVQPADPTKWAKSPFELDTESEPGRLIARGTEDDKAPIATALYAMKAIKDLELPLERRIELIVSLTEESDWAPFREVLENWEPPAMNIAIDSEYPVVVAEKGWGGLWLTFDPEPEVEEGAGLEITAFEGGSFISQVPEDAVITVTGADEALAERIRERARAMPDDIKVSMDQDGGLLSIRVKGRAAHSMAPEEGANALAHAAALLAGENLARTSPGRAIQFVNDLVGLGVRGERFGEIAYQHPFMGPLTVNLSTAETVGGSTKLAINLRQPAGKSAEQLERELRQAISTWASRAGGPEPDVEASLNDAYYPETPPQVGPLLAIYRHFTGDEDARPISIGGGTNARLLPNGVNFGPSMPGEPYTGHSEHEFITRDQMRLNLRMYTAMMAWLATQEKLDS